jgi:glycosyltransferase involved in cell wall biosynthesis
MNLADGADAYPRALLVGPSLAGGGTEHRFRRVAEHLFGGRNGIAVFQTAGTAPFQTYLPSVHLEWKGKLSHPAIVLRLRSFLKHNSFDAVFAFGFYPGMVSWAAVQGLQNRPALILTETNSPHRQSLAMQGTIRRHVTDALRGMVYPRADLFAANSDDGVTDALRYYGVDPKRARRLPNVVDPEQLRLLAASSNLPEQPGDVLSVCILARLRRIKRVDTLLKAAAGLPQHPPWRIDILGDGEDRAALETEAQSLGVGGRVQFHGWVQNPYPIISHASLLVLCSEYEGFSNSVLEAMVLRTPVITSMCTSDAREMCARGAALGFAVGDHLELRAKLELALTSKELRAELGENGWGFAQRHTIPSAILDYEVLVRDAIEQRRGCASAGALATADKQ